MQLLDNHICVAYLVRVGEPYANLYNFIDSFSEHEPGIECNLHIIFKGFSEYNLGEVYTDPLKDIRHTKLFLPDIGIDIDTYFEVATKTCYNYYFFLNSHSIIISPNWLLKIYIVGSKRDVGLTGATGSWGTVGCEISWGLFLFLLATKKNAFQAVLEFCTLAINRLNHPTFPNPHIRTNSFFIRRDIFLESFPGFLGSRP